MEERENSGVMFKNQNKKTDRHPDWRGNINVTCQHCGCANTFEQSSWEKTSRKDERYYSFSYRTPREDDGYNNTAPQREQRAPLTAESVPYDNPDENGIIPF